MDGKGMEIRDWLNFLHEPQAIDDEVGEALVDVESVEVRAHQDIHRPHEEEQPAQQRQQLRRGAAAAEEGPTADADGAEPLRVVHSNLHLLRRPHQGPPIYDVLKYSDSP